AGVDVRSVYEDVDEDEILIVQGIIDAFFLEGDEVVLMDYKTDVASLQTLVDRYHGQLENYAQVIEQLTGKKVKEKVIYSFYQNNEITL
ncbi:MAG: hypothetical protein ACI4EK_06985, partial [Wujia sp.]